MKPYGSGDKGDDTTPEEKQELKTYVENLLSRCESEAPRTYVLEMMRVKPRKKKNRRAVSIGAYTAPLAPILSLVKRLASTVYHAPVTIEKCIERRNLAILAEAGSVESVGLTGENIWLRGVETDEIFRSEDHWLLLRPREIFEIESDFVLFALERYLFINGADARLAVIHAASELLLADLQEDISLIPGRLGEVVEAIDAVLHEVDLFTLTEDGVLRLSNKVVRRVR